MSTTQANPAPSTEPIRTTKRGIDLSTFEDVTLYKDVPRPHVVDSIQAALAALGNDHNRLMEIVNSGLASAAVENARTSDAGWLKLDDDGKPTQETFDGQLASNEVVNPTVLLFAKNNFDYDRAETPEAKRAAKQSAKDLIRSMPKVLEGLQKRSAAAAAASE
jgi:hypothetical protein